MKKARTDCEESVEGDVLPEYDFTGKKGVRGKYYQAYRQGHSVKVHHSNGTVSVKHFELEDGAVMLDPDVRRYFPDSDAVNHALRALIALIPARSLKRRASAE